MSCCACAGTCNHTWRTRVHSLCQTHGDAAHALGRSLGTSFPFVLSGPPPCQAHCRNHCPEHDGQATEETCIAKGCEFARRQKAQGSIVLHLGQLGPENTETVDSGGASFRGRTEAD